MIRGYKVLVLGALIGLSLISFIAPAQALDIPIVEGISKEKDLNGVIVSVAEAVLTFVGGLAVLALIYGGLRYIISMGNEKEIEKAKEIIKYALIGIVVIILAYSIVAGVNGLFDQSSGGSGQTACVCKTDFEATFCSGSNSGPTSCNSGCSRGLNLCTYTQR